MQLNYISSFHVSSHTERQKELQTQQQNMEFTKHFDNITIQKNKKLSMLSAI